MFRRLRKLFTREPYCYGREELAGLIRDFVVPERAGAFGDKGKWGPCGWDDFLHAPLSEPYEQFVRELVLLIELHYPADEKGGWCSEEGGKALLHLAESIRSASLPYPPTEVERLALGNGQLPTRYRHQP